MRRAAAGAALVKENKMIKIGIEESPVIRADAGAGSTVQKDGWRAIGFADLLVVQGMQIRNRQTTGPMTVWMSPSFAGCWGSLLPSASPPCRWPCAR